MKGGRTAPRNETAGSITRADAPHFNEGGADCPPKLVGELLEAETSETSMKGGRTAPRNFTRGDGIGEVNLHFNEGGADCPPKREMCQFAANR